MWREEASVLLLQASGEKKEQKNLETSLAFSATWKEIFMPLSP